MSRETVIEKAIKTLNMLPAEKAAEIAGFADYLLKKQDDQILQSGIETLVEQSQAFNFLNDDEDLYTAEDIKEKY